MDRSPRVSGHSNPQWLAASATVLVFALALGLYLNTLGNEFTNWDDNRYITENPLIRNVGIEGIARIFTRFHFSDYAPLTLLSYAIDYSFWKLDPRGYHVTNILLHALNSALLLWLIARLTASLWTGAITASFFAAHPVQVEVVAWMAQRKTLLAMALFLLAFICHVRSREEGAPRFRAVLAWIFFLLAVLSKPVVVTAPILFVLYDRWFCRLSWRELARRGAPYLIIGAVGLALGITSQYVAGGVKDFPGGSPVLTALLMLQTLWGYLASLVLPISLDNLYISSVEGVFRDPRVWLGAAAAAGIALFAWRQPLGRPISAFAVLWFAVFLLPVSNIIPMAVQRADRYLYLPSAGAFLVVALALERLWQSAAWARAWRTATVLGLGAALVFFASRTIARNRVWQSSRTLWEDHLRKNPRSQTGHFNLGGYYLTRKDYERAVPIYQDLVRINPRHMKAHYNLASIASDTGQLDAAIAHYGRAIEIDPKEKVLWNNLGYAYFRKQSYEDAVRCYQQAVRLDPRYVKARVNMGSAYMRLGKTERAWGMFEAAAALDPGNVDAYRGLGLANLELNDIDAAIGSLDRAARLRPNDAELLSHLARGYLRHGNPDRALALASRATKLEPKLSLAFKILGDSHKAMGRSDLAEEAYAKAKALAPEQSTEGQTGTSELETR